MKRRFWKKGKRGIGVRLIRLRSIKKIHSIGGNISQAIIITNVISEIERLENKIKNGREQ